MPTQLSLFTGILEYRHIWNLDKDGINEARDMTVILIEEAIASLRQWPVTLFDIARRKLRLTDGCDIPVDHVEEFKLIVDQLRDERFRLKDSIEAQGTYRLVFVNEEGNSSLGSGPRATAGFKLRDSDAGLAQDKQSLKMHFGAIERVITERGMPALSPMIRALKSGVIDDIH